MFYTTCSNGSFEGTIREWEIRSITANLTSMNSWLIHYILRIPSTINKGAKNVFDGGMLTCDIYEPVTWLKIQKIVA